MKYKLKQSLQIDLEDDLNAEFEKGYKWVCKLFWWDIISRCGKQRLITYLIEKI